MLTEAEVRPQLDARLYSPVTDGEWRHLQRFGHVKDAMQFGIDDALEQVRSVREANLNPDGTRYLPASRRRRSEEGHAGEHVRALSLLLAHQAGARQDVRSFRSAALRDELIDQDDVATFIERQRALDANAGRIAIAKVAVPVSVKLDLEKDQHVSGKVFGLESPILTYGIPGEEWPICVPVRFGGTLHQLKELSERLSRAYPWSEAQGCVFVLTGATPVVARVRCTLIHSDPSSTSRISLSVDPTVTPKELAERYGSIRTRFLGGRYRSPSPKHLRLAALAGTRGEAEPWADALAAWNKGCESSERYPRAKLRTFARDCRTAVARVLEPRIEGID
ncbi:MAG: hypothetical protein ACRDHM_07965 [Actinomycetota bacterium]